MYLTEIQNHQQANYKDSTVNDDIVVKKWDATFYSKLNIYDFGFNKIFPRKPGFLHDSCSFQKQSTWMWHACNKNFWNWK